jgi:CubicO group peptidase (beta-lactamase class C family)/lysophospholipase L1-like esterase
MNRPFHSNAALTVFALFAAGSPFGAQVPASTNTTASPERRFEAEIRAFAEADRTKPPVPGGILFVGSSIFRQWTNAAEMMAPLPVLNRAFGGSRTGDQLARFDQVVTPYAPVIIVYYCGSNDLKADEGPDAIFERFKAFSERARHAFPEVRVVFVSSMRSPDRVAKWERVDQYNGLVRAYCTATPRHTFIDINPVLVDSDGKPRLELYQEDKLHFHPPAYVELAAILKPVLTRLWDERVASARTPPVKPLFENPDLQAFLSCQLVPKLGNAWDYVFAPGPFPRVEWDRPEVVENVMGSFPLKVQWFDGDGREVTSAQRPGRYAFYVEGTSPGGMTIRRSATLFCRPKDWDGWSEKLKARLDFIPLDDLTRAAWDAHREAIADYAGRTVLLSILRQREGAVLMAYLHELKSTGAHPSPTDTPLIRDHDYHLVLKRKILGVETKYPPLRPPRCVEGRPAAVVSAGTERKAGFTPGTARKLREICREWFEQSGEPFNMVVVRRGVAVLDESFGNYSWSKLARETPTEMASITKLVTGVLFAQFLDQGLIGIDDPVGKYLPDFPVSGTNVLTLRHCFTHATALDGHEEWGGMHNPWLDNVIANGGGALQPGQVHNYNGMGYDLAGKVMEVVGGRSIFRLMRENLFDPLGMTHTTLDEDLGFSCFSTAEDFAKLGQMLLNRGAYGDRVFFSPHTFDQLLPQPLSRFYPAITNLDWGIGITWMRQRHSQAGTNGIPKDATVLSRNVIGHGSATAAILRVDLDHELVITQTRRRAGADYDKHLTKLLLAIEAGLQNAPVNPGSADPQKEPPARRSSPSPSDYLSR